MTKVVVLSHVKVSSVPSSSASGAGRRIPWQGGKIVSNKEEALRKFYERKVSAGGQFNDHQIEALQKILGITVGKDPSQQHHMTANGRAHINPKKLHARHRPHGKVQASTNKTLVINGRVLGPKVTKNDTTNNKMQATRQPQHAIKFAKAGPKASKFNKNKTGSTSSGGSSAAFKQIALEDKLHMSLDALVGGNKNSSSQKRVWK